MANGSFHTAPTYEDVYNWANERARTHDELRDAIKAVEDSYEIVFIPGILGSKLRIGDYTYGHDPIDPSKLVLSRENAKATAEVMDTFVGGIGPIVKNVDVYGDALSLLQDAIGGKTVHEFPYDWRQDISLLADQFQRFGQERLKGKRVVIVAHSMGGLLAWHWKNRFRGKRPFCLAALVIVGSPLEGSCEIVRTLIEGYSPGDTANWFEKRITQAVFKKAHAALFTFPSVFQLLPKPDSCKCLASIRNGNRLSLKPFNFGTWHRDREHSVLRKFSRDTGLSEQEYRILIEHAIESAERFHSQFDPKHYNDTIYLLYSTSRSMPSGYTVARSGDWLTVTEEQSSVVGNGDGRVLSSSALNSRGATIGVEGKAWPLTETHGTLMKDQNFSAFVSTHLQQLIFQKKVLELLAYVLNDAQLKQEVAARGWIIEPLQSSLQPDECREVAHAQDVVAKHNCSQVDPSGGTAAQRALVAARREEQAGNIKVASALYETAWLLDESTMEPQSLTALADLHMQEGRHFKCVNMLSRAASIAEKENDPLLAKSIYSNLGNAYAMVGLREPATRAFLKEAKLARVIDINNDLQALHAAALALRNPLRTALNRGKQADVFLPRDLRVEIGTAMGSLVKVADYGSDILKIPRIDPLKIDVGRRLESHSGKVRGVKVAYESSMPGIIRKAVHSHLDKALSGPDVALAIKKSRELLVRVEKTHGSLASPQTGDVVMIKGGSAGSKADSEKFIAETTQTLDWAVNEMSSARKTLKVYLDRGRWKKDVSSI
jgi:pimeloyl-ACP methyl ester carboxylesterase